MLLLLLMVVVVVMLVMMGLLRMRTKDKLDLGMDEIEFMREVKTKLGLQLLNNSV